MLRSCGPPVGSLPPLGNRNARLYGRLDPGDWALLGGRSSARAIPSAVYVSLVLRSHLRGVAPLPKAECATLKQSVAELPAIGRNLNQIAQAMNPGGRPTLPGLPEVAAMLKVAVALQDHVEMLLNANLRFLARGPAETS